MHIITGTGRSGTSLVCQILAYSGLSFGHKNLLRESDRNNPEGYFEQAEANNINTKLLLGSFVKPEIFRDPKKISWAFIYGALVRSIYLIPPKESTLHRRAKSYRHRIEFLFQTYRDCAIKDPRFCNTIGAWRSFGEIQSVVFCYRHPDAVSKSVRSAYGSPEWVGRRMWRVRSEGFLSREIKAPVLLVSFERLTGSREDSIREIQMLLNFFPNLNSSRDFSEDVYDHCIRKDRKDRTQDVFNTHIQALHGNDEIWGKLEETYKLQSG